MVKVIITINGIFHNSFDSEQTAYYHYGVLKCNPKLKNIRLHKLWDKAFDYYMENGKDYEFILRNELIG